MWQNRLAQELFEAFKIYLKEYQKMSEKDIEAEVQRFHHCHQLAINELNR
jgi:hypothetical protein